MAAAKVAMNCAAMAMLRGDSRCVALAEQALELPRAAKAATQVAGSTAAKLTADSEI